MHAGQATGKTEELICQECHIDQKRHAQLTRRVVQGHKEDFFFFEGEGVFLVS